MCDVSLYVHLRTKILFAKELDISDTWTKGRKKLPNNFRVK